MVAHLRGQACVKLARNLQVVAFRVARVGLGGREPIEDKVVIILTCSASLGVVVEVVKSSEVPDTGSIVPVGIRLASMGGIAPGMQDQAMVVDVPLPSPARLE
jgi:hypothetical protein